MGSLIILLKYLIIKVIRKQKILKTSIYQLKNGSITVQSMGLDTYSVTTHMECFLMTVQRYCRSTRNNSFTLKRCSEKTFTRSTVSRNTQPNWKKRFHFSSTLRGTYPMRTRTSNHHPFSITLQSWTWQEGKRKSLKGKLFHRNWFMSVGGLGQSMPSFSGYQTNQSKSYLSIKASCW